MDSNTSGFFHSVYYQAKEDDGFIDLGLSLRTLQPEAYHPSGNLLKRKIVCESKFGNCCQQSSNSVVLSGLLYKENQVESLEGYDELLGWPPANLNLKSSDTLNPRSITEDCDEEADGVQSKERWAFVKVNMDGIVVGRKICILDHGGYSSLALQLEEMFGKQSASGLRLFQAGSEFSLFYKDREENWRAVGDVPWKEFVECVKRLRIAQKNVALLPGSSKFT